MKGPIAAAWPVTWRSPGIMGWYGLVPFMERYHGIVSFGHGLSGNLEVEGTTRSFDDGRLGGTDPLAAKFIPRLHRWAKAPRSVI
ncbi:MAG: hypothetical protein O2943_05800 [Actinomycetota bacterium]|nr:hypothetical protein [Actinomycetota bacterium]